MPRRTLQSPDDDDVNMASASDTSAEELVLNISHSEMTFVQDVEAEVATAPEKKAPPEPGPPARRSMLSPPKRRPTTRSRLSANQQSTTGTSDHQPPGEKKKAVPAAYVEDVAAASASSSSFQRGARGQGGSLSSRLNTRSRPVITPNSNGEQRTSGFKRRPAAKKDPNASANVNGRGASSYRSKLSQRLNRRSRPVASSTMPSELLDPRFLFYQYEPTNGSQSEQGNASPNYNERPPTPPLLVGGASGDGDNDNDAKSNSLNNSFALSVAFSLNATQSELNSTIGGGDTSFGGQDDDDDEAGDFLLRPHDKTIGLNATFVERLQEEQDEDEPMDWDEIDPGLLAELHACRKSVERGNRQVAGLDLKDTNVKSVTSPTHPADPSSAPLLMVVDTNIFISQLNHLKRLLDDQRFKKHVLIYLPWSVLCELDALKGKNRKESSQASDSEVQFKARKAIDFLYGLITNKSPRLRTQDGLDERDAEVYASHNADDRILQTCLKLRSHGEDVLLYTNDKNLAIKTTVSKIDAFSSVGINDGLKKRLSERASKKAAPSLATNSPTTRDKGARSGSVDAGGGPPASSQAQEEAIKKMFELIWQHVYMHTRKFCETLSLPHKLMPPSAEQQDYISKIRADDDKKFDLMCAVAQRLEAKLKCVLQIPALELTLSHAELLKLHRSLRHALQKFEPPTYHATSGLTTPYGLLRFFVKADSRQLARLGLGQMKELASLLRQCKRKKAGMPTRSS